MRQLLLYALCLIAPASAAGQTACLGSHDTNGNGTVDIEDFLSILGVFGDVDTDGDGVWDSVDLCTNLEACNFQLAPTTPCVFNDAVGICGGDCEADFDNDGICDEQDSCIGIEDQCGICNGPGPTEVVIEDIVITYDSVFLPLDDDWYVFPISADTTFSYECLPLFACGDPLSYQGYDYATVLIGEQCWFAEDLRNENFRNGEPITSGLNDTQWSNTTEPARTVYGELSSSCTNDYSGAGSDACDEEWSLLIFGRLYNWYATIDERNICPFGWDIPSQLEFTELIDLAIELGEGSSASNLKSESGWYANANGSNSLGFGGQPGGYATSNGSYHNIGGGGYWWAFSGNTAVNGKAWAPFISWNEGVNSTEHTIAEGFSVRCIKDSE